LFRCESPSIPCQQIHGEKERLVQDDFTMNEEIVVILDANQSMGEEISDGCRLAETDDEDGDGETGVGVGNGMAQSKKDDSIGCGENNNRKDFSEDFLGTTKFDVARYITQELVLHAAAAAASSQLLDDRTDILALITLGGKQPQIVNRNYSNRNDSTGTKRKRPWLSSEQGSKVSGESNETKDWRMNTNSNRGCCFCYYSNENHQKSSMDYFINILRNLGVSSSSSSSSRKNSGVGDFVTGIVHATDALLKNTTVGASRRRIVLVTDARHKVLVKIKTKTKDDDDPPVVVDVLGAVDPLDELVDAINRLRAIGCTLEVIGMGFRREKSVAGRGDKTSNDDNDKNTDRSETMNATPQAESKSEDESDGEASDGDDDGSTDNEETEDDWSDVQDQNELLLIDLVEKLGGCIQAVNGGRNVDDSYCVRTVLKRLVLVSEPDDGPLSDGDNEITFKNNRVTNTEVATVAAEENRDSPSLRPSPGIRILYWNGSDDVLLPEWIRVARPSCWSADVNGGDPSVCCSWIQIDDPLREPKPGERQKNIPEPVKADGHGAGSWIICCALESVDAVWEKIAVATAYGKLGPTSKVSPTKHLLLQQQQQQQRTTAERSGELCSSYKNQKAVICVGVQDSTDNTDIKRVLDVLRKDLEIDSRLLTFQENVFADIDVYGS
jgi:hypothetical protein